MAKKTESPPSQHSSSALKEFKENLPKSLVPVVLTVLGALAFQSAIILFGFATEEGQIAQQDVYERNRDISLSKNEAMIWEAIVATSSNKHLQLIGEFQEALLSMKQVKRDEFAARLREDINESNKSLGALEGYTGVESTLPQNVLLLEIQSRLAELEVLESALTCTEHPLELVASKQACLFALEEQMARLSRADSRSVSAHKAADASKSMAESERTFRWSKIKHQVNMRYLRALGALAGLLLCVFAYAKLLSFLLESERLRTAESAQPRAN